MSGLRGVLQSCTGGGRRNGGHWRRGKNGSRYRFLAIQEPFDLKGAGRKKLRLAREGWLSCQLSIPETPEELEEENWRLEKLHLMELEGRVYKVFGIVANREDMEGGSIIR